MSRNIMKNGVRYLFIVLSVFVLLNASEKRGYGTVPYMLMKDVCKSKVRLSKMGSPLCLCSSINLNKIYTNDIFEFENLIYGNFTNSNTEEILVPTYGCEPDAFNGGGSMLFSKKDGRWHKEFYRSGRLGECKKLTIANRRDELICLSTSMGQGYFTTALIHYEVRKDNLKTIEILYKGVSNEATGNTPIENTNIKSWKLKDVNHDGYSDVVLRVYQSGRGTKKITHLYNNGKFLQNTQRNTIKKEKKQYKSESKEQTLYINENGIEITLHYPAYIKASQPFLLKATMHNSNTSARMGGLTLSFPDVKAMKAYTVNSTFNSLKSYYPPAKLYSSIKKSTISSSYFMLEGWANRWRYGKNKSFTTELVAPKGLKSLRIDIRGVLLVGKKKRNRREIFSPTYSQITDQQGYYIKEIVIPIK